MSQAGTTIMAAGLVDEGLAFEMMEKKLAELASIIASGMPICPICKCVMEQQNYVGYYDSFSYWGCDCEEFPNGNKWSGQYA